MMGLGGEPGRDPDTVPRLTSASSISIWGSEPGGKVGYQQINTCILYICMWRYRTMGPMERRVDIKDAGELDRTRQEK